MHTETHWRAYPYTHR